MSTSPQTSHFAPLHKGRACTNCRRRKIKCDAQRPRCSQCVRSEDAFGDCEYTDSGMTQTELLESQISILEARIHDLESGRPSQNAVPVQLSSPYTSQIGATPVAGTSTASSLTSSANITGSVSTSAFEDLPPVIRDVFVHNFCHRSYESGFFLNVERFLKSIEGRGYEKPTFALLNAVYLWGMVLSSESSVEQEATFVSRALQSAAHALAENHSQKIIQCVQAEVLLANYFYRKARFLEGKYHTNAAVSLVISSGLHKLRSSVVDTVGYLANAQDSFLPPPRDSIEEGERIDAFWTVFTLNNSWTAVDGSPSNIPYTSPNTRIDTPWPLEPEGYAENRLKDEPFGSHTVQKFLVGALDNNSSPRALHAKASILFEQGARIGLQHKNNSDTQYFATSFNSLDSLISNFIRGLKPLDPRDPVPIQTQLCIHTLARAAELSLHLPFASENQASRVRVINATKSVVNAMRETKVTELTYFNCILAALWTATAQAVIGEMRRSRAETQNALFAEVELRALCDHIINTMAFFAGERCQLMSAQLNQIKESYSSL